MINLQLNNSRFLNLQDASIMTYAGSGNGVYQVFLTFNNITVANNTISIQDDNADRANLFSLQGTKTTVISFVNSLFRDNKVTTSTINIYNTKKVKLLLTSNTFRNNFASYSSTIVSIRGLIVCEEFLITNNLFQDNHSSQKGGVFSIISACETLQLKSNIYINNSAQKGGVGYFNLALIDLYEVNGTYIGKTPS